MALRARKSNCSSAKKPVTLMAFGALTVGPGSVAVDAVMVILACWYRMGWYQQTCADGGWHDCMNRLVLAFRVAAPDEIDELGAGRDAGLGVDPAGVKPDGSAGDEEVAGNLRVGEPADEKRRDVTLTVAEG